MERKPELLEVRLAPRSARYNYFKIVEVLVKLALVQPEITADKASNLQLAVRTIRDAANRKTDLIVFPEMFMALQQVTKASPRRPNR